MESTNIAGSPPKGEEILGSQEGPEIPEIVTLHPGNMNPATVASAATTPATDTTVAQNIAIVRLDCLDIWCHLVEY